MKNRENNSQLLLNGIIAFLNCQPGDKYFLKQYFRSLVEQDYVRFLFLYLKAKNKKSKRNKKSQKKNMQNRNRNQNRNKNQKESKNQRLNKNQRQNKSQKRKSQKLNQNKLRTMRMVKNNKKKRKILWIYYLQAHSILMTIRDSISLIKILRIK